MVTDKKARKDNLVKVAEQSLGMLFGEPATSAVIRHVGIDALRGPEVFEERLEAIFGRGAEPVLKYLMRNMDELMHEYSERLSAKVLKTLKFKLKEAMPPRYDLKSVVEEIGLLFNAAKHTRGFK